MAYYDASGKESEHWEGCDFQYGHAGNCSAPKPRPSAPWCGCYMNMDMEILHDPPDLHARLEAAERLLSMRRDALAEFVNKADLSGWSVPQAVRDLLRRTP